MSHAKIIQAVRIYLDTVETENTALGIFTSGGTSEIRLSEEPLSGVALPWTSGLIALNGIGDRSASGDLSLGGSPANYDGTEIELINTNQYLLNLAAVGVYLPGLKCEIWEFRGTESDNDATSAGVVATYVVEDISGDEERLTIPLKNGTYKRNAQMLKAINTVDYPNASDDLVGKLIPATFGSLFPESSSRIASLAKFIGINPDIDYTKYSHSYFTVAQTHPEWTVFPLVNFMYLNDEPLIFEFAVQDAAGFVGEPTVYPTDMYVEFVDGDGNGQTRRVVRMDITAEYSTVTFYIDEALETLISITGATRTWVRFFDYSSVLVADHWPCKGFVDTSGNEILKPIVFYSSNDEFKRIPDYAYSRAVDADKNSFRIIPNFTEENIGKIWSFWMAPITPELETADDLSSWQSASRTGYANFDKVENGLFAHAILVPDPPVLSNYNGLVNGENIYDVDKTTYGDFNFRYTFSFLVPCNFKYYKVLKFTPPVIPSFLANADNIKIYIGIKAVTSVNHVSGIDKMNLVDPIDGTKSSFHIVCKRLGGVGFLGDIWTKDADVYMLDKIIDESSDFTIDDMPDFYFGSSGYNANFRRTSTAPYTKLTGYTLFELNYTSDAYKLITEIGLFFGRHFNSNDYTGAIYDDNLSIYEMAIIVSVDGIDVSENVFPPFKGRIFNDTWGGRKTAANLITLPNDMLEHCQRLKNWSETGETGIDWGKEYATSALIKTGDVEGSYDRITTLTDQTPAFQLEDESEGYTDSLIQRLSEAFDLCPYIDKDGYECVEDMELHDPAETITDADLADDPGALQEARSEDVYCEPVVNYQYNAGSGEYDKSLRVFNIQGYADGGAWTASSSGFANQTDAESVLDIYAALWRKFRTVEKCPSNFSDVRFFVTYADALSYIIRKGNRMGRVRQPLSINYEKGYDYNVYKHVQLNLAQVTNGNDVECMIEKLRISKRDNRVDLTLVLLEQVTL